ncbi:PREDICTED: cytosolic endo-beta-N-acetylglucosaminidase isoform X2 [Dinoponera quadriceps]|uniref:Cytosolic endo-beta-N-acetylglucosaminidase isoform X2 n=1 Tax=Dinoponera quadriceps TaxID=609295 RepID=A0A6P3WVK7_DINQU|nr:PREDICTED: cytosolic endo-beta-N-acetylglucosaminidase isoform X2 [Dinoponera quadriceps]
MDKSNLSETEEIERKRMVNNESESEVVSDESNMLETEENTSDLILSDELDKPRESKPFDTMFDLYEVLGTLEPYPETDIVESVDFTYQGSEIVRKDIYLKRMDKEKRPKTLVCHDMKGGYLEDRFFWGSTSHDSYLFYNWYAIDTFVYFSHHFITVPPYGWICTAHKHGVKILGTIITEGDASVYAFFQNVVASYENAKTFADALVDLTKRYGFDGWLLNFETNFTSSELQLPESVYHAVDKVLYFVKYLTDTLHKEIENSEVIWYDSLVRSGALQWQDELNEQNKDFFLNCDGIYLNYHWKEEHLERSSTLAKELGRDVRDVYVGLDVFGRGTPDVGEFNCSNSMDLIRKYNFSVAIFAPGWTHEYFGPQYFNIIDDIFWSLLFRHLHIHVPIYEDEVFRSTFCRGAGRNYYYNGQENPLSKRLSKEEGFYELHRQQPQLSVPVRILNLTSETYIKLIAQKTAIYKNIQANDDNESIDGNDENANDKSTDKDDEIDEVDNIITPMTRIEKLYLKGWHIIEDCENLTDKSIVLQGNTFEYCNDFSYEGGGCLRMITRNEKLYHRLFLVYVNFKLYIQASIVYAEAEAGDLTCEPPILILGRNSALKAVRPYDHFRVNKRWWKCIYLTDFKTIDEIGVLFQRACVCYLGEIVLDKYDQIFGNDPEYIASQVSDYHIDEPISDSPPWQQ